MNNEHLQQKSIEQRITDVEAHLAHLQKINDELSNVMFGQQKQIAAMEKLIGHLQNRIGDIKFQEEEPRTLEDDRPPHY
ncbi:MAG: SlyX protein [Pirellulaceae bacterium]|jgi:SlyX protein